MSLRVHREGLRPRRGPCRVVAGAVLVGVERSVGAGRWPAPRRVLAITTIILLDSAPLEPMKITPAGGRSLSGAPEMIVLSSVRHPKVAVMKPP